MPLGGGKDRDQQQFQRSRLSRRSAIGARWSCSVICVNLPHFTFSVTGLGPRMPLAFTIVPDLVDQRLEARAGRLKIMNIVPKRILGADRFPDAVGLTSTLVDARAIQLEIRPRLAEVLLPGREITGFEVGAGFDAGRFIFSAVAVRRRETS